MSRPTRGLGRGLASLIPDSALDLEAVPGERDGLRAVPIEEIRPNPEQPREVFEKGAIDELAASIRAHGILSPLVVRRTDGRYILIAGERRLRAAALAGLKEVPVVVRDVSEPSVQLELALVENLQRADLDPIEAARGFQRLIDEYGYTQDQVAVAVGRDRSTIAILVRLLKLPELVLSALRASRITAGHARALLAAADDPGLPGLLARVIDEEMSVRQTERLIGERAPPAETADRKERKVKDRRAFEYAVKLIEEALQTSVSVKPSSAGTGGRIVIDFSDGEDFERLLTLLQRGET